MKFTIDINCDIGEGITNEIELLPYISSCSIACGGHAGDKVTIIDTIKLAQQYHINIGAHPSFPDKKNFGRKEMHMSPVNLQASIENQINLVQENLKQLGGNLHHVKAHGALYNLSAIDTKIAQLIINAVKNTVGDVFLYVPYNSIIEKLAIKNDVKVKIEAFADRNYNSDLTLVSREKENAILTDPKKVSQHILKIITKQKVISIDGLEVELEAETFCIHSDNSNAKNILKSIHKMMLKNKIKVV